MFHIYDDFAWMSYALDFKRKPSKHIPVGFSLSKRIVYNYIRNIFIFILGDLRIVKLINLKKKIFWNDASGTCHHRAE